MAFHQPARQALHRFQVAPPQEHESLDSQSPVHVQQPPAPNETENWVLFSPNDNATSSSYLIGSSESVRTAGRSRPSDLGSLDTNARSEGDLVSQHASPADPSVADQNPLEEDPEELDSLDSHLPDFRVVQSPYVDPANAPSAPLLPRHDGLGSFRADHPTPGADIQDRLYAFEQFNPNRVTRHDGATAPDLADESEDSRRLQRIESWSLEQSRLVLEHIQKETRTGRQSQSSTTTKSQHSVKSVEGDVDMAKPDEKPSTVSPGEHDHLDWHDGDTQDSSTEPRGLLSRVTRTFLKDMIGLDEELLSALLGGSLPDEAPEAQGDSRQPDPAEGAPWQESVLERVAKELGVLINRVSHHPGAFSTYSRMQRMPLPYAGLPVIPETSTAPPPTQMPDHNDGLSATIPEFRPTMTQSTQTMGAQDSRHYGRRDPGSSSGSSNATFTQEEWEQDLDIKLVFRYLRSRFGSRTSAPPSAGTSHLATSSTQDMAAKAARVRAHHPLVASRPRTVERRSFKSTAPGSPVVMRASSCASQSTRRSRRSSCSSRHYWDIGGSLGTGSVIASTGPMGSWGEV